MEIWKLESNPANQTLIAVGAVVLGAILMAAFHDLGGASASSNGLAGFLLGVGLLALGAYSFIAGNKKQVTSVDPESKTITVTSSTLFGTKERTIAFDDVADVVIGRMGRTTGMIVFYYPVLKLHDGEECPLFPPGYFYEGGHGREIAEKRREKLLGYIGR
ncbi:MAG: hypothetical protein B7W98_02400 [Parcubacteria group bacterium 20-58-5]|nr:MAG: hypothetical protein B7W98_02400 [Parcubacteria group bacterium 20-58-5]